MIKGMRVLIDDLRSEVGPKIYAEYFIRQLPHRFGMHVRELWYRKRFKKCGANLHVMPGTYIINPQNVECGDNFFIGVNNYIQAGGGLRCGDNVMLGPYAKIWTQNHLYADSTTPVWKQGHEYREVVIGNDVWLGANSFVMPGAIIGDRCVIAACSVVGAKNYPGGLILAGNPARKIGER